MIFAATIGSWVPGTWSSAFSPCGRAKRSRSWTWRSAASPSSPRFWLNSSAAPRWPRLKSWGNTWFPGLSWPTALADLAGKLPEFQALGAVVAKRDRAHLGLGVSLWPSLETLYSLAGLQGLTYPLVVQPFLDGARDLRVVALADYVEAYERVNPHSFRKNLFQGGSSQPAALTPAQQDFCRQVMARGRFPYAILDLLLDPRDGRPYLSEISFKGGLTGARLSQAEFHRRVAALEEDFIHQWETSSKTRP